MIFLTRAKLPRIPGDAHEMNWVDACKGKTETSCPFEYAARLTEVMLLGIVALRAGGKISYDGANMRVTNLSANIARAGPSDLATSAVPNLRTANHQPEIALRQHNC